MSRETSIHAENVSHSGNKLNLGYSEIFDACHFALESTIDRQTGVKTVIETRAGQKIIILSLICICSYYSP